MGVRYSASDSAQLIQAMTSNLQVANQVTDRLSSGCDHLIASLDSGELQGAAYTAGKGLFTDIIIPCIKKLQAAIDDIQGELNSYKYADSTVAEYGTLDLDLLKEELKTRQEQLAKVEEQIAANRDFMFKFGAFVSLIGKFSEQNALRELENQLNISIWEIQEKIDKLEWFVADVSKYFTDSLEILRLAIQGAVSLSQITIDAEGNYYTNGADMSWVSKLKNEEIRTYGRGVDPKISLINQSIRELMLPDEAAAYYRKQLLDYLEGKPSSDWSILIQEFNQSLRFDHEGNILTFIPTKVSDVPVVGEVWFVLKNGHFDKDYTQRFNDERGGQFWESIRENAAEFLAGVGSIALGAMIDTISLGGGAAGLVLSIPSFGTLTIPIETAAAAGFATGTTIIAGGTIAVNDAIIKTWTANASLNVSFAQSYDRWQATKPTSKTFGTIEGKVGGRKGNIRVDAEPHSGKVQIQSGGGKSGYRVNAHRGMDEIVVAASAREWIDDISELNKLSNYEKNQLVKYILKAVKWLKS